MIRYALPVFEAGGPDSGEILQILRDLMFGRVAGRGYLVFTPRLVIERNHPVMEHIQKFLECPIPRPTPFDDEQRVHMRQNAGGTGQSHEIHIHQRRSVFPPLNALNFARRKSQAVVDAKAHNFAGGMYEPAHGFAMRIHALQDLHRLEELDAARVGLEERAQIRLRRPYTSTRFPVRGGHVRSASFLCRVRAARTVKLFSETYNPRNRSSRLANTYTPPPVKCSSSKSISTRRPRTKLTPSSEVSWVSIG